MKGYTKISFLIISLLILLVAGCDGCGCNEDDPDNDGEELEEFDASLGTRDTTLGDTIDTCPETRISGSFSKREERKQYESIGSLTIESCDGTIEYDAYFLDNEGNRLDAASGSVGEEEELTESYDKTTAEDIVVDFCVSTTGSHEEEKCFA